MLHQDPPVEQKFSGGSVSPDLPRGFPPCFRNTEAACHALLQQMVHHAGRQGCGLFISYAWESEEANNLLQKKLVQIETHLKEAGYEVFLDIDSMDKNIAETMATGIKEAHKE
ncbi:MAG: hypothetical protein K0R24_361 [Gammaproteobacteria bacterium]|jgi:hypothetical protein|nr:hypothetical protein [Gammaproteobacteria bacterium]